MNSRAANRHYIAIGNTPLPHNKVASWNNKLQKSKLKNNDVNGTHTGVAPSGINYNECNNSEGCGWCFNCHGLVLHSKSSHSYFNKEYGTRKRRSHPLRRQC